MSKWDIYARENPFNFGILSDQQDDDSPRFVGGGPGGVVVGLVPYFKLGDPESNKRFKSFVQILDLLILDLESYNYDKLEIVASAIYCQIGLFYRVFNR